MKSQKSPVIFEEIQRCHYCGIEMTNSPLSYIENPFCNVCLPERTRKAEEAIGLFRWKRSPGNYLRLEPLIVGKPS
jgi:hypothetical protein